MKTGGRGTILFLIVDLITSYQLCLTGTGLDDVYDPATPFEKVTRKLFKTIFPRFYKKLYIQYFVYIL